MSTPPPHSSSSSSSSSLFCFLRCIVGDLVVDTYLDEVVRTLEEQGLTNDAEEVEIHKDGHWDPILEDQKVFDLIRRATNLRSGADAVVYVCSSQLLRH